MDLSFAKRLEVNCTNECVLGGVRLFQRKRKKPGCCPHTPHPTHPPHPRPITGDAVEGCVRCFKGWHTQTGRVNWGIVNLTHLFSSRLSHMKPLKLNYCYSGSLLSFVPSLHSDRHTSRQRRRRQYWKRRYERLSSHASIASASAIWRRRSWPRRRKCSWSVSQSPFHKQEKSPEPIYISLDLCLIVPFGLCFGFSRSPSDSASLAPLVVSNMDKEQRRNSPGEWVSGRPKKTSY